MSFLPSILLRCRSLQPNRVLYPSAHCYFNQNVQVDVTNKRLPTPKLLQQFVKRCPKVTQPYLKLMRVEQPIGSWLLFWPCSWGIMLATPVGQFPSLYTLCLFGSGALLMRGAGCTINDIWDRKYDGQVLRTKNRPLVDNSLSVQQAIGFLSIQLTLSLIILLQMNWYSIFLGSSSLLLVTTYPLMKRITYWPQLVLGFTFNWGCLLGYSCVHGFVDWPVCLPVYLAGVCWTLIYDTIYAHQDKVDDLKLGLKSTALKFDKDTKKWLSMFSVSMISLLIVNGVICEHQWPYYVSLSLISSHLMYQIVNLNTESSANCLKNFKYNKHVGCLLFLGLLFSNLLKPNRTEPAPNSSP